MWQIVTAEATCGVVLAARRVVEHLEESSVVAWTKPPALDATSREAEGDYRKILAPHPPPPGQSSPARTIDGAATDSAPQEGWAS